jgi:aspartate/methionine/tyrosine aminotransferase
MFDPIADRPLLRMTSDLGRVMAAARAREEAGQPVIHLERGEPDFDTPPHIVEALERAARGGETHYPDVRGSSPLREALAGKLARENRLECHVDDIVVTLGGTHALFLAFQALLASGDELLVLSPHWMAIPKLVAFVDGASIRTLPAYLELMSGQWSDTQFAARLRAAITPATKGMYLNTPNNPTGAVLTPGQLQAIADVAIERNLWVVSDEAYEHLLFDGSRHVSIASLPGMAERTVTAFTFSKSYAMTGWRVGYVVSPPSLRSVMGPILSFYTTHGVFPAVQTACRAAVLGSQDCVEQMRVAYDGRRRSMLDGLRGQDVVTAPTPRGTFYVFAHVALAGRDLWTLVEDWLSWGVAVLPGTAFGAEYTEWVRMSLAARGDQVAKAARILRERHAGAGSGVRG